MAANEKRLTGFPLFAELRRVLLLLLLFLLCFGVGVNLFKDDPLGHVDDGPDLDAIVEQIAAVLHLLASEEQSLLLGINAGRFEHLLAEVLDEHSFRDLQGLDGAVDRSNLDLHVAG